MEPNKLKKSVSKSSVPISTQQTMKAANKRFIWDTPTTEIYLRIAIEELDKGNFRSTSFNKDGWNNLLRGINHQQSYKFDMKQLKNRWNKLRDYWSLYKRLGKMIGVGWYPDGITIQMDDDWWNERIQENSKAAEFRDTPPMLHDMMQKVFDPVVAYASKRRVPNAGLPQVEEEEDSEDSSDDMLVDAIQSGAYQANKKLVGAGFIDTPDPPLLTPGSKNHLNSDYIAASPEHWTPASTVFSASAQRKNKFSISNCMKVLRTSGITEGTDLWLRALDLFHRSTNREIFMMIDSDHARSTWIMHASSRIDGGGLWLNTKSVNLSTGSN